jgi:hypothetical protein
LEYFHAIWSQQRARLAAFGPSVIVIIATVFNFSLIPRPVVMADVRDILLNIADGISGLVGGLPKGNWQ